MTNNFDAHDAANRARDIRGAYLAQSLSAMALSSMVKATISSLNVKSALGALASTAPLAGHRV